MSASSGSDLLTPPPPHHTAAHKQNSTNASAAPMSVDDSSTMPSFLQSCLTLLYQFAPKKLVPLRHECVGVLAKIKSDEKTRQERIARGEQAPQDTDANKYFLPLKMACDTGQAKLVAIALDTMEKLIAYGYLDGNCVVSEEMYPNKKANATPTATPTPPPANTAATAAAGASTNGGEASAESTPPDSKRKLINIMIETLYECSMFKDSLVQRQVVKALLTTVSSVSCPVHDHGLLQAVTSCYQIYLQAGDETNRTTSKAALTQIFNIVFQRMEHFAAQLKQLEETAKAQREQDKLKSIQLNEGLPNPSPVDSSPTDTAGDAADAPDDNVDVDSNTIMLDLDTESEAHAVEPTLGADESDSGEYSANTPNSVMKASPSLTSRAAAGKCGYCVVCSKPANHLCLQTKNPVCGMECKLINLTKKDPNRRAALSVKAKIQNKLQILQNDAYYLLRALIKLSHKSFVTVPPEQAAVDSKLLSLTLLLSVMQSAGPQMQTNKNFIQLIKVDLVNCLLRNSAASNIDSIFTLTSNIFIALLKHFKPHLHKVIGPMLDSIYLPYIQSPNSSFEHKQTSLLVLKSICENQQLIVDLFLNYDCDIASFSTFQKIAEVLEKTTQKRVVSPSDPNYRDEDSSHLTVEEEMKLKTVGLEALVGCINSLAAWTYRIVKPNAQQMDELQEAMDHASSSTGGRTTALAAIGAAVAAAAMNTDGAPASLAQSPDSSVSRSGSVADEFPAGASPSPPPSISTGLTLASSFSTQFQFLRAQKQKLDTGVAKFNQKPKVGIAYLQQHSLLGTEPKDLADFFHSNSGLDKIQLGDFLGDEHEFNKKVLYCYVEKMDFRSMPFDDAIRLFVQGFRLPGEAQKIDRMMEKFAEQYHRNNPGRFHSADTAYVLAYSIILLNTDAHNPGVKRRMTKDDFFKNCRGIDDGKDIDPTFLGEIYDRITTNEITLKDDPLKVNSGDSKAKSAPTPGDTKKRFTAFVKESQLMVKRTQELIKTKVNTQPKIGSRLSSTDKKYLDEISKDELDQPEQANGATTPTANGSTDAANSNATAGDKASDSDLSRTQNGSSSGEKTFYEATDADAEAIRPMFEILCFPSLATFSVLLEESEVESVIRLCLQGYRSSIRIANALEIQTARLAFVSSLKKFTLLGSGKTMRPKHIEAISALLGLAATATEGNYLGDNWLEILQCISEVERLHLIANNNLRLSATPSAYDSVVPTGVVALGSGIGQTTQPVGGMRGGGRETEQVNSMQVNLIDASAIDRVFAASAHLNGEAIVDFVNALRQVSEQELANIHAPRVFSLMKMVEITYHNMGRIRVVWNRIWSLLSEYFQKAGCHPNLNVSMYAIDSLRQLAMKFLEKDELTAFQFQKLFLKPFEFIMTHNSNTEIRELVLQCVSRMISAKAANIKSGWKGVFMVLTVAATTSSVPAPAAYGKLATSTSLIELAFTILANVMDNYFHLISETGLETMDETVRCLITFGCNQQYQEIASKSIQYLTSCAATLNREPAAVGVVELATPSAGAGSSDATVRRDSLGAPATSEAASAPSTPKPGAAPASAPTAITSQVTLKVWFLVLTGLSRMIGDPRTEVRSLALTTLFNILNTHGHVFSIATWRAVFHGVLFPIFDDVRYANERQVMPVAGTDSGAPSPDRRDREREAQIDAEKAALWKDITPTTAANEEQTDQAQAQAQPLSPTSRKSSSVHSSKASSAMHTPVQSPVAQHRTSISHGGGPSMQSSRRNSTASASSSASSSSAVAHFDNSWLETTCFTALSSLVDLFARFHSTVHFLLPEVLKLINSCISQDHAEPLAKIGVRCFVVLLQKIGSDLTVGDWWIVLASSADILTKIIPTVLIGTKLRETLMLPTNTATTHLLFQPFLARPVKAGSDNVDQADVPSDVSSSPLAHTRSSSALPASTPTPPVLPFALPGILTRIKVQLWLVEAIFQVVMSFFPSRTMTVKRTIDEDRLEEELATGTDTHTAQTETNTDTNETHLFQLTDRRVLGCFTPNQTLFAVDLLGECINFTHSFNADIMLRRKLHGAGFHIPIPPAAQSHATVPPVNIAAPPTNANPHSTVPASPAPVPHVHATHQSLSNPPPPTPHPHTAPSSQPKPARLPQLFYHEAHALRLAMDILFRLVSEGHQPAVTSSDLWLQQLTLACTVPAPVDVSPSAPPSLDVVSVAESRIVTLCHSVIEEYVTKTQSGQLVSLENFDEVLVGLINNYASMPSELFAKYIPDFYLGFTQLIEYASVASIRHAIRMLFANKIGAMININKQ